MQDFKLMVNKTKQLVFVAFCASTGLGLGSPPLGELQGAVKGDLAPMAEAARVPVWIRKKVIFWKLMRPLVNATAVPRAKGQVIDVSSSFAGDGSFHVTIILVDDASKEEVEFEFWDSRGYNASLDEYHSLLGKRISILLTIKMYSLVIVGPER